MRFIIWVVTYFALYLICRFLFDESCGDYKYYEYRLAEEEKLLSQEKEIQTSHDGENKKVLFVFFKVKKRTLDMRWH